MLGGGAHVSRPSLPTQWQEIVLTIGFMRPATPAREPGRYALSSNGRRRVLN